MAVLQWFSNKKSTKGTVMNGFRPLRGLQFFSKTISGFHPKLYAATRRLRAFERVSLVS